MPLRFGSGSLGRALVANDRRADIGEMASSNLIARVFRRREFAGARRAALSP
ncbi:MAG: hypothetical protein JWP07_2843, partial [Pseudonocardiales bacterium]|nr:hypothetical protein [Pseudonocardiales bacterium]